MHIQSPPATRDFRFFITGVYFGVLLIFVAVWLQSPPCRNCFLNYFSNIYLAIPFLGAVFGLIRMRRERLSILNSVYNLALLLFCMGILLWSLGNVVWMFHNFVLKTEIPYPSLADAGYLSNLVLWIIGILILYKIAGTNPFQEIATPVPIVLAIAGAIIWITLAVRGGQFDPSGDIVKFFLDIIYPLGGVSNFTLLLAFVLGPSAEKIGLESHWAIYFISLGILCNLVADFSLTFTTSLPAGHPFAYYNGNWSDFFYATAFYFLAMGVLLLPNKLKG